MRLDDVPEPGHTRLAELACPRFDDTPRHLAERFLVPWGRGKRV